MTRSLAILTATLCLATSAAAGSLWELRPPPATIPEPSPGQACPVPPLPAAGKMEGEGWSLYAGIAWKNFDLDGARYYVEYELLKRIPAGIITRPFPSIYMVDLNRNGAFDIPGEAWVDVRGDGRCADLVLVPGPHPPQPGPELKRPAASR